MNKKIFMGLAIFFTFCFSSTNIHAVEPVNKNSASQKTSSEEKYIYLKPEELKNYNKYINNYIDGTEKLSVRIRYDGPDSVFLGPKTGIIDWQKYEFNHVTNKIDGKTFISNIYMKKINPKDRKYSLNVYQNNKLKYQYKSSYNYAWGNLNSPNIAKWNTWFWTATLPSVNVNKSTTKNVVFDSQLMYNYKNLYMIIAVSVILVILITILFVKVKNKKSK